MYADLHWAKQPKGKKMVIHRKNPPTIYASIDHGKVGPPLPPEPELQEEDDIWGYVPDNMQREEPDDGNASDD